MVRKFCFLKRRRDIDRSAFSAHWRTPHAKLIGQLREFWTYTERYIQNHVRAPIAGFSPEPLWDGVVECWQRPQTNYEEGFTEDPVYLKVVRPDEPNFIEVDQSVKLFAEEKIIIDGPRSGVKLFALARRAPGLTLEQFHHYWSEVHGPNVRQNSDFMKYARRYVQHHVLPDTIRSESGHPGYDGIVELWFDSIPDAVAAYSSATYLAALRADERAFVADPPSPRLVVDEVVVPRP
jgi:uncharacterized protein (TIGR02118 family)